MTVATVSQPRDGLQNEAVHVSTDTKVPCCDGSSTRD